MQNRLITLSVAAAAILLAACGGDDSTTTPPVSKIVNFSADLKPSNEPGTLNGNTSGATGKFTATLDTSTNVFTWNVQFSGMSSNVTAGHIHGPFPSGSATSAGVILNFASVAGATLTTGATTGTATGTATLNSSLALSQTVNGDSLKKLLLAGQVYANIHTTNNGAGEIRGQIAIAPQP
jgi:ABC-type phosphate/phosphonate transport system substrate-binding protein